MIIGSIVDICSKKTLWSGLGWEYCFDRSRSMWMLGLLILPIQLQSIFGIYIIEESDLYGESSLFYTDLRGG